MCLDRKLGFCTCKGGVVAMASFADRSAVFSWLRERYFLGCALFDRSGYTGRPVCWKQFSRRNCCVGLSHGWFDSLSTSIVSPTHYSASTRNENNPGAPRRPPRYEQATNDTIDDGLNQCPRDAICAPRLLKPFASHVGWELLENVAP